VQLVSVICPVFSAVDPVVAFLLLFGLLLACCWLEDGVGIGIGAGCAGCRCRCGRRKGGNYVDGLAFCCGRRLS
jgi:hypothetical protein